MTQPSLPPLPPAGGDLAGAIYEIGLEAALTGALESVIARIVRAVLRATDGSFAGIALLHPTEPALVHTWGLTADERAYPAGLIQPMGEGVVGETAKLRSTVAVQDVTQYPSYVALIPGIRSEVAVPLLLGDRLLGVLDVESSAPSHFHPGRVALLEAVATPIARSIEAARLFRQTHRRMDELAVLNHVSRMITSTVDLEELMQRTVAAIRQKLGYTMVALGLVDHATSRVVLRAVDASEPVALPVGFSLPVGVGVTGAVVRSGESVLVRDVQRRADYVGVLPSIRCEMCCPLRSRSGVIGFLDAATAEVGSLANSDLLLLETLADHAAQAIENAWTLQRVGKLREELYSMVVHDLRNPLTVVMSALDMMTQLESLRRQPLDATRAARTLGTVDRLQREARAAGEEMMVLIGGLLDLQKLESGKLQPSLEPCIPSDLVRSVASRMGVVAEARRIALATELAPGLPTVRLDATLLGRVLENLVINALKFTPEGGHVRIEALLAAPETMRAHGLTTEQALLLRVVDDGPGIPAADRDRIFEKFALVEANKSPRAHSTGLGLAFCKRALELHHGAIWVQDQAPAGSAFCLLLPI